MGNCNSEIIGRCGLFEYYVENDMYEHINRMVTEKWFNFKDKLPIEHYGKHTCSYLHLAVKYNSRYFVSLWITKGLKINILDSRGWTVLHWAVYYNSPEVFIHLIRIMYSLLDKRVILTAKCKNRKLQNKTPLEMAIILKRRKIIAAYNKFASDIVRAELPRMPDTNTDHIPYAVLNSNLNYSRQQVEYELNHADYNLGFEIQRIGDWSLYSDTRGNNRWVNHETNEITTICPPEIYTIEMISYVQ